MLSHHLPLSLRARLRYAFENVCNSGAQANTMVLLQSIYMRSISADQAVRPRPHSFLVTVPIEYREINI